MTTVIRKAIMDGQIIDIRGHRAEYRCAFEGFVQLYRRTFTDPAEAGGSRWGMIILVTGVVIRMWGTKRNK
jgi:hypothetical protein